MIKNKIWIIFIFLIYSNFIFAEDFDSPSFLINQPSDVINSHRLAGDIFQVATNVIALSIIGYHKDKDGFIQYLEAAGATFSSTYLLKYITHRKRPISKTDYLSFPSGHTSMSFVPAHFINNRYNFLSAIAIYGLAIFTGISRIESRQHYTSDVAVGALLGIGFAQLFTTKFGDKKIRGEKVPSKTLGWLNPVYNTQTKNIDWNWGVSLKY